MYFRREKKIKERLKNTIKYSTPQSENKYGHCERCKKEIVLKSVPNENDDFCSCEEN